MNEDELNTYELPLLPRSLHMRKMRRSNLLAWFLSITVIVLLIVGPVRIVSDLALIFLPSGVWRRYCTRDR